MNIFFNAFLQCAIALTSIKENSIEIRKGDVSYINRGSQYVSINIK